VKARNRYRIGRPWLAVAAILFGILAGYAVGRESILHSVKSRLADYADRILQRDEDLYSEISTTLVKANASPFPACSDDDLVLLRRLTFAARFLKDVARLGDGRFLCSATSGKLSSSLPMFKPDITLPSGAAIYRNLLLNVQGGVRADVVALRKADVVISPDNFAEFPREPVHYNTGVLDRSKTARDNTVMLTSTSQTVSVPVAVFDSRKSVRVNNKLYNARCSHKYPVCAVTSIQITEVWRTNRGLLLGYAATGGIAGLACASALLAAGRKKRSHSNQLKRAILMGKLSVVYQPIVELGSHRIVGAEALARWTDEDGDSIRAETIIALAEAEGFVSEVTRFVLLRSLDEIRPILEWNPHFRLNINLAPSDLADPRLLLLLDERLQGSLITPANIAFELPERATSDREVAIAAIRRLRHRGHATFIDDFGTGYSNLAYLTELDVDGIKINRSFIATIGTDSVTASIVPQILEVAKALSLKVVVQGIERQEQADYFATNNPLILGQGWFFGLPVPAKGLMYLCAEKTE
jgi:sensor c-di-GMP phosphodiesterase-like protein